MEGKEGSFARAFRCWRDLSRPILLAEELERGDHGSYSVPFSFHDSAKEDALHVGNMMMCCIKLAYAELALTSLTNQGLFGAQTGDCRNLP